jgi:uncharacterized protein YndB with AHSA1/START domain
MSTLSLALEGDTVVVIERHFAAPPEDVFRAHMDPELVRQWMLGPDGWTMPVCINEGRPGGKIRYEWTDGQGGGFYLTGEIIELDPPHRSVHVERMHLPDPTPDNRIETTFTAVDGGTRMVMRMSLPDAATRKAMLETGMDQGMEASYQRLEQHVLSRGRPG